MSDGSVTRWLLNANEGNETDAEQALWDEYFARLVALARRRLEDLPPHLRDEEDVALSALNSFFMRTRLQGHAAVHDRTALWRLLATITARKASHRRRRAYAQKRGGIRRSVTVEFRETVRELAASGPTPDVLAAMNEECEHLLGSLGPDLRKVACMKLEGYTNHEIAAALGGVDRTVERKLARIRHAWLKQVERS
jgi:DNA-directed RNA polymerase specialized sigma24 family protein